MEIFTLTKVGRTIDVLRRGRGRRFLISKNSEDNLRQMAITRPNQARAFLKNLLRLNYLAVPFERIVVPANLGESQNLGVLSKLREASYIIRLIGGSGALDLRKAGLKKKAVSPNFVPTVRRPTFDAALEIARKYQGNIIADDESGVGELGDLILFEAILIARVELYILGEKKSAAKASGNTAAYDRYSDEMRKFAQEFSKLLEVFPLPGKKTSIESYKREDLDNLLDEGDPLIGIQYRDVYRETIETAYNQIAKLNNPAADATLAGFMDLIMRVLENRAKWQAKAIRESRPEGKIRIVDEYRGKIEVDRWGYVKEAGVKRKVLRPRRFKYLQKFLRHFDHYLERDINEKAKNEAVIKVLGEIPENPLASFDKIFDLSLGIGVLDPRESVEDLLKDKYPRLSDVYKRLALIELWCVVELCRVPSDQAHRLAASLIHLAARAYGIRNRIIDAQIESNPREKAYGEQLVSRIINGMVKRWVGYFAKEPKLRAKSLDELIDRLEKYYGTLFGPKRDKKTDHWVQQCRSHIMGIIEMVKRLKPIKEEGTRLYKRLYSPRAPWSGPKEKRSAAAELERRGIVKRLMELEDALDKMGNIPIKAARLILQIEFDFNNRGKKFAKGERQKALECFYREKAKIYNTKIAFPKIY
jgi:hypothetical protein